MNIVVLAGGTSPERDVSLSSGALIADALRQNGQRALLLDLLEGIPSLPEDGIPALFAHCGERTDSRVPEKAPTAAALRALRGKNPDGLFGPHVLDICRTADLVFLALHGEDGENGKLQACFDLLGIRYTGSGSLPSALAMDKWLTKLVLKTGGVETPFGVVSAFKGRSLSEIASQIGMPCVVKPLGGGSSIGVSIVSTLDELEQAMQDAAEYDASILIEEYVAGREFSVGVLDGQALPPIEIRPLEGFYDYRNKYQPGLTEEICPAVLPAEQCAQLCSAALEAHRLLGLGSYSRIDFILTEDGRFLCLEANTLPGMTPTSLLPQEAAALSISYSALCEKIAELAMTN